MRGTIAVIFALVVSLLPSGRATADVPMPQVTGPVTGGMHGHALWDSWFRLADVGYTQDEYFVSGQASNLDATAQAPYTTRIIVTRPVSAADFNGTVLLDWVNVTAQFENGVDTLEAHEMLLREGFAWVHVSAQAAGVCCTPLTPKTWDPVRYAPLNHPGDDYSFDMFSQVAKAVRSGAGMGGLEVSTVLAAGQSQSASRLDTYVRRAQASAGVIDGFLIHGGGSKAWPTPPAVPVLHLLADTEADPAQPTTSDNYSLWEIAGSSHSDFWLGYHQVFGQGPRALGHQPQRPATEDEAMHAVAGTYGEQVHPMDATCILAGSTFPMRHATSAALHHLNAWARGGSSPPQGPRYEFDEAGQLALDAHGNALGGIRLPPIDVPVAHYVSQACGLGGLTVPFDEVRLRQLYPTHDHYRGLMQAATDRAVQAGFLLEPDAAELMVRVSAAANRWPLPV